jgi:3-phenylpropionate/trans-cinnamate dioxygenase ferredoxin reductase subunit
MLPADRVIVATGSRPRRMPVADLPGVVHLRSAADVAALRTGLESGGHVLVVGAGLIGTEVASSVLHLGCTVTVVEACALPMTRILGADVASFVASLHRNAGVDLRTSTTLLALTPTPAGWRASLSDGTTIDAAAVVVGIGVEPATELAADAGLAVDNGIDVDERCRTSTPEVLAAGDVTNHPNVVLGVRLRLECFANAQDQGVTAAHAALGRDAVHARVPWGWSDQLGVNLQMAGVPALAQGWCRRGDLETGSSIDLGLADGRVVAAVGLNRGRDIRRAMKLIEQRAVVDPALAADDDVDLRSLAQAPVR